MRGRWIGLLTPLVLLLSLSGRVGVERPMRAGLPSEPSLPPPVSTIPVDALPAAAAPEAIEEARAAFAAALRARAAGDLEGAASIFAAAAGRPALADWATLLAAESLAGSGDLDGVRRLLAEAPADLVAHRGWRALVSAHAARGESEEAAAAALAALPGIGTARDSAFALAAAGKALLAAGEGERGRAALVRAVAADAGGRGGAQAADLLASSPARSAAEVLALARHRLAMGSFAEAARLLDAVPWEGPLGDPIGRGALEVELGDALLARRRPADAERRALSVLRSAPAAAGPAGLHLVIGRARLRSGRPASARTALAEATGAAVPPAMAQEALFILADLDEDAGWSDRAAEGFARVMAIDPASAWGGDAAVRLGTLHFVAGRYQTSLAIFERYRVAARIPWRRQQASYWTARAALASGDEATAHAVLAEAVALDPVGYYGLRASALMGGDDPASAVAVARALSPGPAPDAEISLAAEGARARVRLLDELGLSEAAEEERARVFQVLGSMPGGMHALAEIAHREGRLLEGVRIAREARRMGCGWDLRLLRAVYPLPFAALIENGATAAGVAPALVAALIRQESLFHPEAVSPVGAVGLMQLMPATARGLAARNHVSGYAPARLRDPGLNVRLGALHLSDLLASRGGRLDEVLAAYNAGDGRLARWKRLTDPDDPDLLLERIPFRETRDYVRTVQENAAIYSALYW